MTTRNQILIVVTSTLFASCFDMTRYKNYSITKSFISYDSSDNSYGQQGKKFKYSYEEFNADSNLIYQEIYANTDYYGYRWGKLIQKANLHYKGKLEIKETIEIKTPYLSPEGGGEKGTYTYTFEYKGNNLTKILHDNKPVEEYLYYKNNNEIERRFIKKSNVPVYDRFTFRNGLEIECQHFVADTVIGTDTLIYDKNNRHIKTISRYEYGKMRDTVIKRNDEGKMIEKKWREYYQSSSDYPFYHVNKYSYDDSGRLYKIDYYLDNKLMTVYEFKYD